MVGGAGLAVGVMLPRELPADQLVGYARRAEELGFAELWVVEDLGFAGGVAQAATVLASTSTIIVGIGILPAGARNVAFTAMELTTLARLFPGRLRAGIGHGMPAWMRSVGAWKPSPLTLLEEYLRALRALLHGEEVSVRGRYVQLDGIRLETVADLVPPVLAGVRGPRSLAVAGAVADGVILAEPTAPEYVAQALQHIGRSDAQVVAFAPAAVHDDASAAIARIRPALAVVGEPAWAAHLGPLPFARELAELRAVAGSADDFAAALPESWIRRLALVGRPEDVRAGLSQVGEAGAQTVVLIPVGGDPFGRLIELARVVD
jgi:alkanesulfonate monooxygenase SsuD/methylene tetrahydromethanopterin reductase-like flavin-dependent oxidoreductase (luciferase family)